MGGKEAKTATSTTARSAAIAHSAPRKPSRSSNSPPRKNPTPFIAFLLPVNQATHLNNCPDASPAVILIADLLAVLVRSFATPHTPCARTTHATDKPAAQSGDNIDSNKNPMICVARPTLNMRVMPKRAASQPPMRFANTPAASYNKNRNASVKGE